MKKRTIGILSALAVAGASILAVGQGMLSRTQRTPDIEKEVTLTVTPTSVPSGPCAYEWASQALPDITAKLQAAVQEIAPDAEIRATAFGENCVYVNGSSTFGAMETDFYVTVAMDDLSNDGKLGAFIEKILSITDGFSYPRVPGPNAGFVEFTFRSGEDQRSVRVKISQGKQLRDQGLHGAELLQALENQ